jgi:hypothetical protein
MVTVRLGRGADSTSSSLEVGTSVGLRRSLG